MDSEGEQEDCYFSDGDDDDAVDLEEKEEPTTTTTIPYKIVNEDEIRQLQKTLISDVCSVLRVSRSVASTLLLHNNWRPTSVYDQWFTKGSSISSIPPTSSPSHSSQLEKKQQLCSICLDETKQNMLSSAFCTHLFCVDCWTTYIAVSINDGPGCLKLPCPEPGCDSRIGPDMVESLASDDDRGRYYHYLYRSYVESNPAKIKWCPSPGCDFAILLEDDDGSAYEVICDCGYKLCWKCGEESHSPLDCGTVSKWMEKNNSEAENTVWILAYTKPCPKCQRAIEKNQGCNHMTCRQPCNFQFCWVCLGNWNNHSYKCNMYKENKEKTTTDETSRENARKHLEKYTHYYERWDSNDKARKSALENLKKARDQQVEKLSATQMETIAQLKCVVEAWEQIVECRRVLKWTYAYGYYLSESGSNKLDFFGYLQGEAENALEKLHYLAEKEMIKYLKVKVNLPLEGFNLFRTKLVDLTAVTKNYFGNLVRALENNLCEVWN